MFNLYPGSGLGFTGSKEIAFGLSPVVSSDVHIPLTPPAYYGGGYSPGYAFTVYDNGYSAADDDNDILEALTIIFGVVL